jgi:hypothetical protein
MMARFAAQADGATTVLSEHINQFSTRATEEYFKAVSDDKASS